mgnify:FL=1
MIYAEEDSMAGLTPEEVQELDIVLAKLSTKVEPSAENTEESPKEAE